MTVILTLLGIAAAILGVLFVYGVISGIVSHFKRSATMAKFVRERDIDAGPIYARGGANCGDENFWVFKCPHCTRVYLGDFEVDTVYLDPADLSRRVQASDAAFSFLCEECRQQVPIQSVWNAYQVAEGFWRPSPELVACLVTRGMLLQSPWAWCLADSDEPILKEPNQ